VKVLKYWPWALLIIAALLLIAACNDPDAPASPSPVEIEHHYHHSPSHSKAAKPRTGKAPAYRAPSRPRSHH
jgi:hypothetical protein